MRSSKESDPEVNEEIPDRPRRRRKLTEQSNDSSVNKERPHATEMCSSSTNLSHQDAGESLLPRKLDIPQFSPPLKVTFSVNNPTMGEVNPLVRAKSAPASFLNQVQNGADLQNHKVASGLVIETQNLTNNREESNSRYRTSERGSNIMTPNTPYSVGTSAVTGVTDCQLPDALWCAEFMPVDDLVLRGQSVLNIDDTLMERDTCGIYLEGIHDNHRALEQYLSPIPNYLSHHLYIQKHHRGQLIDEMVIASSIDWLNVLKVLANY